MLMISDINNLSEIYLKWIYKEQYAGLVAGGNASCDWQLNSFKTTIILVAQISESNILWIMSYYFIYLCSQLKKRSIR